MGLNLEPPPPPESVPLVLLVLQRDLNATLALFLLALGPYPLG